jgi:lauroyl/myristoyl acyltransferase
MLSTLTYILAVCVGYLGAKGGPAVRSILASMIAWAMEKSSKHRRETTLQNIIQAYPTYSREWAQSIAHESYVNFATCYVELFATRYLSRQQQCEMFSVPANNEITSNVQRGRGAIILSAHIGNWELFPLPRLSGTRASTSTSTHADPRIACVWCPWTPLPKTLSKLFQPVDLSV